MPQHRVRGPDGRVHIVEAPEGASQEQIVAFARSQIERANRKSAPISSFAEGIGQAVTLGFADEIAARGLAPFSLAQKVARGEVKISGIGDLWQKAKDEREKLQTEMSARAAKRLSDNVKEAIAGGVVGGAMLPFAAMRGATPAARLAGYGAQAAGYGAIAGAGAASPGERVSGAVRGAILGGAVGVAVPAAVGGAVAGVNAARGARRVLTGDKARDVAAAQLRENVTDAESALANLRRNAGPQSSGALPTMAEAALDPGLAGLQASLVRQDNALGGMVAERMAFNQAARQRAAADALGDGNPGDAQILARARQQELERAMQSAVGDVGPLMTPEASGEALRAAMAARREAERARASALYERVDMDEPLQVGSFDEAAIVPAREPDTNYAAMVRDAETRALAIADDLERAGFNPEAMSDEDWFRYFRGDGEAATAEDMASIPSPGRTLSKFQAALSLADMNYAGALEPNNPASLVVRPIVQADGEMSVRELANRMRRLRSLASSKNSDVRQLAGAYADIIDGFLRTRATGRQAEQLAEARAAWRRFKRTFDEREPGRVLQLAPFSSRSAAEYALDAARVPRIAVPRGVTGATAARRVQAAAGFDAAQAAARQELRRALDGATPSQIAKVVSDYRETLRAYPDLRHDVMQARGAAALVEAFPKTALGRLAGDVDPVEYVSSLISSGNSRNLARLAGDLKRNPAAMQGLRRAVGLAIERASKGTALDATGEAIPDAARMERAINAVLERSGSDLLTPAQRQVLESVRRELQSLLYAMRANRVAGSNTPRDARVTARIMQAAAERAGGAAGGSVGAVAVRQVLAMLGDVMSQERAAMALLSQAVLDPRLAAELLSRNPAKAQLAAETMFNRVISGSAVGALVAMQ